ncbi:MAG: hypothetical protein EA381_00370 [Planctomycetaceae bacterium]|nr:MAG: hypothetical protein EA381_00370 [Planctomycetaceae bacterium]
MIRTGCDQSVRATAVVWMRPDDYQQTERARIFRSKPLFGPSRRIIVRSHAPVDTIFCPFSKKIAD